MNMTMRSDPGYGAGLSKTVLTTEKIAVFAPIPSASAATAAIVNAGLCRTSGASA
jgi:16S rRNA C1402 (ribose-2'-O) methylase RsmI